jgi:hypothetical protein
MGGIPTFFLWIGFKFLPFILGLSAIYIFFYWLIITFDYLIIDAFGKANIRLVNYRSAMQSILGLINILQGKEGDDT